MTSENDSLPRIVEARFSKALNNRVIYSQG